MNQMAEQEIALLQGQIDRLSEKKFDLEANISGPDDDVIKNEKVKIMREVVDKLKPRYRDLIEMRYFQELSYEEIGEKMNLPLGTVKAQLFRAREFMAEILKHSKDNI